ncbi:unnamed protein product [Miscanthus lutarioriparius]|uniref:Uncharacterized protein n=1 Tax=Miscanthus lutarioriparius TaxID=422564 RepID=A0A811RSE7_9POAL|nr:unnamed protein product [Miscanthus lutarioriparius]
MAAAPVATQTNKRKRKAWFGDDTLWYGESDQADGVKVGGIARSKSAAMAMAAAARCGRAERIKSNNWPTHTRTRTESRCFGKTGAGWGWGRSARSDFE